MAKPGQPWTAKNQGKSIMFGGTETVFMKMRGGQSDKIEAKAKKLASIDSVENGDDFPGDMDSYGWIDSLRSVLPYPMWWITTSGKVITRIYGALVYKGVNFPLAGEGGVHDANVTSTHLFCISGNTASYYWIYRWDLNNPSTLPTTVFSIADNDWPTNAQGEPRLACINADCTIFKFGRFAWDPDQDVIKTVYLTSGGSFSHVVDSNWDGNWTFVDNTALTQLQPPAWNPPASCPTDNGRSNLYRQANRYYYPGDIVHLYPDFDPVAPYNRPYLYMVASNYGKTSAASTIIWQFAGNDRINGLPLPYTDGEVTWVYGGNNDTEHVASSEIVTFTAWSGMESAGGQDGPTLEAITATFMAGSTGPSTDGFYNIREYPPTGASTVTSKRARILSRAVDGPSSFVSTFPKYYYDHTPFTYPNFSKTIYGLNPAYNRVVDHTITYGILIDNGTGWVLSGETIDVTVRYSSRRVGKRYLSTTGQSQSIRTGTTTYTGKRLLGWVRNKDTGEVEDIYETCHQGTSVSGTVTGSIGRSYVIEFSGSLSGYYWSRAEKDAAFSELPGSTPTNYTKTYSENQLMGFSVFIGNDKQYEYYPPLDYVLNTVPVVEGSGEDSQTQTMNYRSSADYGYAYVTDVINTNSTDATSWSERSKVSKLVGGNAQARIFYVCEHEQMNTLVHPSQYVDPPDNSSTYNRKRFLYSNGTLIHDETYQAATNAQNWTPDPVGYSSGGSLVQGFRINEIFSVTPLGKKGDWSFITNIYDSQDNGGVGMISLWGASATVNPGQFQLLVGSDGTHYTSITLNGTVYGINSSLNDMSGPFMYSGIKSK